MRPLRLNILLSALLMGAAFGVTEPNQAGSSVTEETEMLRQQVQLQRVSAMEPNQSCGADVLKQLVSQIKSLEMSANPAGVSEPNTAEKSTEQGIKPAEASKSVVPVAPRVSGDVTAGVEQQPDSIDKIEKPVNTLAAADVLYRAKDYQRALRFYEMAAESKDKNNTADSQWAMYQAANCLRYLDAAKAEAAYQKLIAEYPNSAWTAAAIIQQKNLEWFKRNQPVFTKKESGHEAGGQ